MIFEEYHEINRKYGCKIIPFDIDLNKFTKEEYRERIEYLYNAIINDNSNEEDDF